MKRIFKILVLKNKLKLYRYKLKFVKFINYFKLAFYFIKDFLNLLLHPQKLLDKVLTFVSYFNKDNLALVSQRFNLKIAGFIAIVIILVAGGLMIGGYDPSIRAANDPGATGGGGGGSGTTGTSGSSGTTGITGTSGGAALTTSDDCTGYENWLGACTLDNGAGLATVKLISRTINGVVYNEMDPATGEDISMLKPGLIGIVGNLWGYTYEKPVSMQRYIANVKENLNLAPPVYARDPGSKTLEPILPLWITTRDIALTFSAIILVAIGFMILLGMRMGQSTVTLTNALPTLFIAIMLILFSYPLAGLVVDMVDLSNAFIYRTFQSITNLDTPPALIRGNTVQNANGDDPLDPLGSLDYTSPVANQNNPNATEELPVNIFSILGDISTSGQNARLGIQQSVNAVVTQIMKSLGIIDPNANQNNPLSLSNIIGGVVGIIFSLALFTAMFKTFFALLSAYVSIILKTIIAPLQLLGSAFPGGASPVGWFKSILSDAAVFPAVFAAILVAAAVMGSSGLGNSNIFKMSADLASNSPFSWFPMPLGKFTEDGTASGTVVIASFIAYGILLFLPNIPGMVKGLFKTQDTFGGATKEVTGNLKGFARHIPVVGGFIR